MSFSRHSALCVSMHALVATHVMLCSDECDNVHIVCNMCNDFCDKKDQASLNSGGDYDFVAGKERRNAG